MLKGKGSHVELSHTVGPVSWESTLDPPVSWIRFLPDLFPHSSRTKQAVRRRSALRGSLLISPCCGPMAQRTW